MEVNFQLYPCLWRYNQKVIFIIYSLVNGIFGTEGYGGRGEESGVGRGD